MRKTIVVLYLLAVAISPALAGKVTIKVIGPNGKPVAGAQVLLAEGRGSCPAPGITTPKTDKLGVYTTRVKGRAVAYVYKPGFVETYIVLKDGVNPLKLEPAGQVWGSVLDTKGKPVADAEVRLVRVTKLDGSRFSFG